MRSSHLHTQLQHETKQKNPIFLSVMWFNVSVSIRFIIVDVLLESRHSQTQRLHHRTRALCVCVFARSGSVGKFYKCAEWNNSSECIMVLCVILAEQTILAAMCLSLGYLWQAWLLPQSRDVQRNNKNAILHQRALHSFPSAQQTPSCCGCSSLRRA